MLRVVTGHNCTHERGDGMNPSQGSRGQVVAIHLPISHEGMMCRQVQPGDREHLFEGNDIETFIVVRVSKEVFSRATAIVWAAAMAGIQRASHRSDQETCAKRERKVSGRTQWQATEYNRQAGKDLGFGRLRLPMQPPSDLMP